VASLDRYELLEKIATGGMADVFVALQRAGASFIRTVVIKRLHAHLAEQPEACAAFESEGRILALLDHPAIPHALDFGMDGDSPYLVMQHLNGPTLKSVSEIQLGRGRPIPLHVGLSVALALADALDHAHDRRDAHGRAVDLVHQDLTPSNIVLRPCGRVGLLDFGIATTARDRRGGPLSGVRGTTGYMSPEQFARRHQVDRRADVFLLGQLIWEITVGRSLFPTEDLAFFEAITRGPFPTPRSVLPEYPEVLEAIVMRALAREPDERQSTARELRDDLLAFAREAGLELGEAPLRAYVELIFPVADAPRYLPEDEEHGTGEVPELMLEDDDEIFTADASASLSDRERRELLDELDLFAAHLDGSADVESEPEQPSAVLGSSKVQPPPVPAALRGPRGRPQGSPEEDSGVYMQLEPGAVDQVFRDD